MAFIWSSSSLAINTSGVIEATVGAKQTGSIKWDLWYIPLEVGAYIASA